MDWLSASEIVFGLVLQGDLTAKFVNPALMHPPYDKGITILSETDDLNKVVDKIGVNAVTTARLAIDSVDTKIDWLKQVKLVSEREQLAISLEREAKNLRQGKDVNVAKLISIVREHEDFGSRYVTLDQVEPSAGIWTPSFYQPQDEHIGGFPQGGLTIIGAPPGTGKTSLMLRYATGAAKQGLRSLVYTLEMSSAQLLYRLLQIQDLKKSERKQITVSQSIMDIDEVFADASRLLTQEKYHFMSIDFADLLLTGEEDEQSVGKVYRRCSQLAKETDTPIVLLSQLNRNYVGGLPHIHNIRWSGLAEAMGALILMLYNPNQIFIDGGKNDKQLQVIDGRGYIIEGKSRFGFKSGGVGAVQVDWDGETAWGTQSYGWYPLHSVG